MGAALLYVFAVLLNLVCLFLQVFFTILYSDLEVDFINPIDLCNRLNPFMLPEIGAQLFLTALFLVTGHWFSLLINLPLAAFHVKTILNNQYTLDATEIFRTIGYYKKVAFAKLGFYLLIFFFYLYSMIVALVM